MGLEPILERHNAFQWDQFDAPDAADAGARCVHSLNPDGCRKRFFLKRCNVTKQIKSSLIVYVSTL